MKRIKNKSGLRKLFHVFGIASIGGAIGLQVFVFRDIITKGYSLTIEQRPLIFGLETVTFLFALIYFPYLMLNVFRSKL